jgi:2-polyprenyl-3-methyl-5-hydroxy-6-metoxy-1,4-benzoquinol methylase
MQECDKIRSHVMPWLKDKTVLDLGCGSGKIVPWAVGVDSCAEWDQGAIQPDLVSEVNHVLSRNLEASGYPTSYDVVFSSHTLEHMPEPIRDTLNYWQSFVKQGGRLILYLPDERYYRYSTVAPQARNPAHRHYLTMDTFLWHCQQISRLILEEAMLHVGPDLYSFCVVLVKE